MKTGELDKWNKSRRQHFEDGHTQGDRRRVEDDYQREPESSGLLGSIQRVLATTVAALEIRIELLTVELKELKGRALGLVFWGLTLMFLGFLTLVAMMGTVVFLFWDHALAVLGGFSAFFVVLAITSFFLAKGKLEKIPFGETVDQLKRDREVLKEHT